MITCYVVAQLDVHYSLNLSKLYKELLVLSAVRYLIEKVVECWESFLLGKVTRSPKYNNRETPLF